PGWEAANDPVRAGEGERFPQGRLVRFRPRPEQIAPDAVVKQERVLRNVADRTPPGGEQRPLERGAADGHPSLLRCVEADEQVRESRLARTGRSGEAEDGARLDDEVDARHAG